VTGLLTGSDRPVDRGMTGLLTGGVRPTDRGMTNERLTDRVKPKYSEISLSECHCIHHKFHVDWPGIEPYPSWGEASMTGVM
jgi:hypothetical protein